MSPTGQPVALSPGQPEYFHINTPEVQERSGDDRGGDPQQDWLNDDSSQMSSARGGVKRDASSDGATPKRHRAESFDEAMFDPPVSPGQVDDWLLEGQARAQLRDWLAEDVPIPSSNSSDALGRFFTVGPGTTIGEIPPEEDPMAGCTWEEAWDDVSGHALDPERVAAARQKEMEYVHKKGVWRVIPISTAHKNGWKVIQTRWIDVNKGDNENPNYRSRLVAKEFNTGAVDGLFAATPPLEALRLLISLAATVDTNKSGTRNVIMINDVARAFFEAPATRAVCVKLPPEAGQTQDMVGVLQLSLIHI